MRQNTRTMGAQAKTAVMQNSAYAWKGLVATLMAVALMIATNMPLSAHPDSFADLAEKLSPAVVNISTVQTVERRRAPELPDGTPFQEFFEQFQDRFGERGGEEEEPRQATSLGSGFIIDKDGYVVTNNHVIDGADEVTVIFNGGREFEAKVVGTDVRSDLALLKIEGEGEEFPAVKFAKNDDDRIGEWVMAIGNPFGLGGTVTVGIISGRNREVGLAGPFVDYIQTDAPINRGNSGGPLFNMKGQVIGVNSAILSPSGGNVGIGFAIPATYSDYVIQQLKEYGRVRRGWLGVVISEFDEDAAKSLGITDITSGILVSSISPDSPAETAGFEVGDVIYRWDGKRVENRRELQRSVASTDIGKAVKVDILRDGKKKSLSVVTGELPENVAQADEDEGEGPDQNRRDDNGRQKVEGMVLSSLSGALRNRFNIDEDVDGVVVTRVSRRAYAFRLGIRPGAVIQRVNQQTVATPQAVLDVIEDAREAGRESVLLLISYRGVTQHAVLELKKEKDEE